MPNGRNAPGLCRTQTRLHVGQVTSDEILEYLRPRAAKWWLPDDMVFIGNNEKLKIRDFEGIDNLLEAFKVELKSKTIHHRYGAVIDADDDLEARWRSFQGILSDIGYGKIPSAPSPGGTIIREVEIAIGGCLNHS